MKEITSYDQYLKLFQSQQGDTAYWLQQSFLSFAMQGGDWDSFHLDSLPIMDYLTHILYESQPALKAIWEHPQEKVERIHKTMASHQVREMDSYCVTWLSRKEGRTKREKVKLARKIMGVKRVRSTDTGENRLFLAFMKKMLSNITLHLKYVPPTYQTTPLLLLERQLRRQLREEQWAEVGQWQNLPPNNALLSHKDYSVIWKGWGALRALDQSIATLFSSYDQCLLTVLHGFLLYHLKDLCYCPQSFLGYAQETFHPDLHCLDGTRNLVTVQRDSNTLTVSSRGKTNVLSVKEGRISLENTTKPQDSQETPPLFTPNQVSFALSTLLEPLCLTPCPPLPTRTPLPRQGHIMADLFPFHPVYFGEDGTYSVLPHPLLLQSTSEGLLRCHHSRALHLHDGTACFSLYSTLPFGVLPEKQQFLREINRTLLQDTKEFFPAETLTLLSPDGIDDFSMGDMQGNVRSFYSQVEFLPKSLGLAYHHQHQPIFSREQNLVVVDCVGNHLSFTPLKPTQEELFLQKNNHPYVTTFDGLVWERHPTLTHLLDTRLWEERLTSRGGETLRPLLSWISLISLWGLEGLSQLPDGFPFFLKDNALFFWDSSYLQDLSLDISSYIDEFLRDRGDFLEDAPVVFLTSCPHLSDSKHRLTSYSPQQQYQGCYDFQQMQQQFTSQSRELMLWRDMLPQLEIHVGIQEIPLVRANEKIRPIVGIPVHIPISDQMKLEKGKETYRFKVKKEDSLQRYQAVVQRASFAVPPEVEIHCKLEMTYEYGAPEPYCLFLVPLGLGKKTKVDWVLQQEEDWQDLAYPPFPEPADWEEVFYGKTSRRLQWLKHTWVPLLEPWEMVTADQLEGTNYLLETPTGSLRFYKNDVDELVYDLEHPRFAHQKPAKNGAVVPFCYQARFGRGSYLTPLDKRIADQRFGLYRLFSNGRTLEEFPSEFSRPMKENVEALALTLPLGKIKNNKVSQFHFLILCLLHQEFGEEFYLDCQELIHGYQPKASHSLPDCVGFALGDLSTQPQQNLLKAVWTLPSSKIISILSKSMWNHEDFLPHCPSAPLLEHFDQGVDLLGELYKKLPSDPYLTRGIASVLEYMLGVFRLRSLGDPDISKHLSLNHPKMQTLKSLITTMGEDPISRNIYSNIQLKRKKTSANHKENFFTLFLLYLVGDLGGADIQIIQSQQ